MKVKSSKGHNPVSECLVQALYFLFFIIIYFYGILHRAALPARVLFPVMLRTLNTITVRQTTFFLI